jgi:hypothetical protein
MEFLIDLLRNFFFKFLYDFLKDSFNKTLKNPSSRFYYKKIVEKLKIAWFAVKVYVALAIFKRIASSSMFRSASKDLELKIVIAVVLVMIVAVVATVYRDDKKKLD